MYCHRSLNTKTNRKHEGCLRMVYNDKKTNFNELLVKDSSVSIHHQNLQKLAVEMFQVSRDLSPEIVNESFQFRKQIAYELRKSPQFQISSVLSVFRGTEKLKSLGPKIWALMLNEMKQLESLGKFKHAIKQWKRTSCSCGLCKKYIRRIGFL